MKKRMMIGKELKILLTAIMFYTRIPVPANTGHSEENLNRATRYLPLVGILIGGSGALVFSLVNRFVGVQVSILLSLGIMVMLTGAFHEDGLADFCDGFGGGYSKEQVLSIMKDSRIGTYGAIALIFLFISKILLLSEIQAVHIPVVLISSHALSRLNPVILIFTSGYVNHMPGSKSKPVGKKISAWVVIIAAFFALSPLLLLHLVGIRILIVAPVLAGIQLLILLIFRWYVHRRIGGYTGDVLGALQQISETGYYFTFLLAINLL